MQSTKRGITLRHVSTIVGPGCAPKVRPIVWMESTSATSALTCLCPCVSRLTHSGRHCCLNLEWRGPFGATRSRSSSTSATPHALVFGFAGRSASTDTGLVSTLRRLVERWLTSPIDVHVCWLVKHRCATTLTQSPCCSPKTHGSRV